MNKIKERIDAAPRGLVGNLVILNRDGERLAGGNELPNLVIPWRGDALWRDGFAIGPAQRVNLAAFADTELPFRTFDISKKNQLFIEARCPD